MSKRRRRQRLPQELITATIERLSHEGRGISQVNDKVLFVDNALPGETVAVKYSKQSAKYAEGYTEEIIANPSADRIKPICDYYGLCGGCGLQHMAPQRQIAHKQAVLVELLAQETKLPTPSLLPPLQATTQGYRRKARLGVRYVKAKEKVLVGFREKNGRFLANMDNCQILHPQLAQLIKPLQNLFIQLSIYQHIPQVEMAMGDERAAIIIRHLEDLNDQDLQLIIHFAKNYDYLDVYLQANKPAALVKLYPNDQKHFLSYALPAFELDFHFHPSDFTQVNSEINQQMVSLAIELLDIQANDHVLDLFCGLGNFSLALARRAAHVVGVEGEMAMVNRAKDNAALNNLTNCEFHLANLFEPANNYAWYKKPYQKLLLDPPRSGAKEFLQQLHKPTFKKIVYVSCNPNTLARDAHILIAQHGYKLQKAGVMDMFPHTHHVESIAVFEK